MNPSGFLQPVQLLSATGKSPLRAVLARPQTAQRHLLEAGLLLPFNDGRRWISLSQIIRLEGVGNYTNVYFLDGSSLLVALSLKVLASRLPADLFMRPHRKHLLNRHCIKAVSAAQLLVVLTTGEQVPLARRRVGVFRRDWHIYTIVAARPH